MLGICRGAQALNVARGGTLHQHVAGHRQTGAAGDLTHAVHVEAGSRLAALVGAGDVRVNSFHHQAVERLGRGLRAVAHAPDGTIEGIEAPAHPFLVGVQWHAEGLVADPAHRALFGALVDAAAAPRVVVRAA